MPLAGQVLVLAAADDGEAELVADRLTSDGVKIVWLDLGRFPGQVTVNTRLAGSGWEGQITTPEQTIDLSEISAVFYRQSQPFDFPAELSESEQRFATVEARFGLGGLLASLPARWVPAAPGTIADSEYKPVQLATAARCGLVTAATVLTNDARAARRFAETQTDGAVYKALMHKAIADDGDLKLIYTSPVTSGEIDDRVSVTMHQFQANLVTRKRADVRVVATRRGCVAIAIRTDDAQARQDFRTGYDHLAYEPIEVPGEVAAGCRRYLEALGLQMGIFDFCMTGEEWMFLECGPGAQWAWLTEATRLPIASLIADALTGGLS